VTKRLLIIDDEPAISRLIERVAVGCGYSVTVTAEPDHFMDELISCEPDLIVLDLSLPTMDGVELLRFLATSKCRCQILIVSGFDARVLDTTRSLGEALGLRIAGTLNKPIRVSELRDALSALEVGANS
jgi:DNA-binding response OmpR family regulator